MAGTAKLYCFPESGFDGSVSLMATLRSCGHEVKQFLSRDPDDVRSAFCVLLSEKQRTRTSATQLHMHTWRAKHIFNAALNHRLDEGTAPDLAERARSLGFCVITFEQLQQEVKNMTPTKKPPSLRVGPNPRIIVEDFVCGYPTMELRYTVAEAEARVFDPRNPPPPGIPLFAPRDQWAKVGDLVLFVVVIHT